jgi:uncharacterized Rmd1/YagE family protein
MERLQQEKLIGRALFIGQRLDLRAFEKVKRLMISPLMVSAGAHGVAVLFRYGVVVLFGLNEVEEEAFLNHLKNFVIQPFDKVESEEVDLVLAAEDGVDGNHIQLSEFNVQRLQVVADVLAKSVVLGHYETALAQTFDRIEPLATKLQAGARFMHQSRELLRHIGDVLLIQSKMVGRVEVSEKPELLWEQPQYERLFIRLEDEFELRERFTALERKLDLVSRTAETSLDLLQNKRSLRVEWYIVILIVVEIILTFYELWWH